MNNVIAFPRAKKNTPPQTMEELIGAVEETRKEHIEFVIDEALSFVFSRCYDEGFDLGKQDNAKTSAMLVEALRAALYDTCGISHPFHMIAESLFVEQEEGGEPELAEDVEIEPVTE